jgi:hypothetical protein
MVDKAQLGLVAPADTIGRKDQVIGTIGAV